mmetsp:Transcript_74874/g.165347  ORF Transcript_74874/g.165347 Transcript_74874/m.165347 type:complete len:99 (-) Transcript_74874:124-420(-)
MDRVKSSNGKNIAAQERKTELVMSAMNTIVKGTCILGASPLVNRKLRGEGCPRADLNCTGERVVPTSPDLELSGLGLKRDGLLTSILTCDRAGLASTC